MVALMPADTGFAAKLRTLRERAGLTQAELARLAGINHHSLTKLEHGDRQPNWTTVLALAEALGCTPNDFLADETPTVPPRPVGRPRRDDSPAPRRPGKKRGPAASPFGSGWCSGRSPPRRPSPSLPTA
jgi:transcriptional regulator with XRE-family HTH domain